MAVSGQLIVRLLTVAVLGSAASAVAAQAGPSRYDTRAQLEAQAKAAESANRTAEAWLLRSRLKSGDFQEGDRIVVVLENAPAVIDTMQVRAGKVLQFPRMADLSLEGVLRSELTDTLRHHLSKYLTNPGVRATPLLPLAVVGSVRNPGFYYMPADVVLRDVIMRAGGPLPSADLNKSVVRRTGQTIWNSRDVNVAMSDGISLDRLHLHAGDEVYVPEQRRVPLTTIISLVSASVALAVATMQLSR